MLVRQLTHLPSRPLARPPLSRSAAWPPGWLTTCFFPPTRLLTRPLSRPQPRPELSPFAWPRDCPTVWPSGRPFICPPPPSDCTPACTMYAIAQTQQPPRMSSTTIQALLRSQDRCQPKPLQIRRRCCVECQVITERAITDRVTLFWSPWTSRRHTIWRLGMAATKVAFGCRQVPPHSEATRAKARKKSLQCTHVASR